MGGEKPTVTRCLPIITPTKRERSSGEPAADPFVGIVDSHALLCRWVPVMHGWVARASGLRVGACSAFPSLRTPKTQPRRSGRSVHFDPSESSESES